MGKSFRETYFQWGCSLLLLHRAENWDRRKNREPLIDGEKENTNNPCPVLRGQGSEHTAGMQSEVLKFLLRHLVMHLSENTL